MMHFTTDGQRTSKPENLNAWQKVKVLIGGVNIPRPMGQRSPGNLAGDCGVASIPGPGGITLEAWYCDRGRETPLVILFHGYAAEKTSLMAEAGTFLDLGASVMLVDFRGSGGSTEAYTAIGVFEAGDVAEIIWESDPRPHAGEVGARGDARAAVFHSIAGMGTA